MGSSRVKGDGVIDKDDAEGEGKLDEGQNVVGGGVLLDGEESAPLGLKIASWRGQAPRSSPQFQDRCALVCYAC